MNFDRYHICNVLYNSDPIVSIHWIKKGNGQWGEIQVNLNKLLPICSPSVLWPTSVRWMLSIFHKCPNFHFKGNPPAASLQKFYWAYQQMLSDYIWKGNTAKTSISIKTDTSSKFILGDLQAVEYHWKL